MGQGRGGGFKAMIHLDGQARGACESGCSMAVLDVGQGTLVSEHIFRSIFDPN